MELIRTFVCDLTGTSCVIVKENGVERYIENNTAFIKASQLESWKRDLKTWTKERDDSGDLNDPYYSMKIGVAKHMIEQATNDIKSL